MPHEVPPSLHCLLSSPGGSVTCLSVVPVAPQLTEAMRCRPYVAVRPAPRVPAQRSKLTWAAREVVKHCGLLAVFPCRRILCQWCQLQLRSRLFRKMRCSLNFRRDFELMYLHAGSTVPQAVPGLANAATLRTSKVSFTRSSHKSTKPSRS